MVKIYPKLFLFIILLIIFPIFISCTSSDISSPQKSGGEQKKTENITDDKSRFDGNYIRPKSSGAVTLLPWDKDDKFIKAQAQNNTHILMSAYCAVLRDPLPGEEYNVQLAAQMLAGTVISPDAVFSQNQKIGPYTEARGFKNGPTYIGIELTTTIGGGVCKIASTLYNVAVLSGLQVVERHSHGMPVPYVPYGQDATVAYGGSDFKFRNNTGTPVLIWSQGIDNLLFIGLYGNKKPPLIEWRHEISDVKKAPRVYRKNSKLAAGTERVICEGMDGAVVDTRISITSSDGLHKIVQLGKSRYKPMPYIIEKGE